MCDLGVPPCCVVEGSIMTDKQIIKEQKSTIEELRKVIDSLRRDGCVKTLVDP